MKKVKIIYHAISVDPLINCPDGISAAVVAAKWCKENGKEFKLEGAEYQGAVPSAEGFDSIIVVDFSFPRDVIEAWIGGGIEVIQLDHHKTAQENFLGFDLEGIIFDMRECGATLTWKYFFPGREVPAYLEYVKDRDLWNFDLEGSKEIHEAISALGRTPDRVERLLECSLFDLVDMFFPLGRWLLGPKRAAIARAAERMEWVTLDGESIPLVRLKEGEDRLVSDICEKLYTSYPCAFVACLTTKGNISLRSDKHGNNTDVGEIAKRHGGGGHRNASGFKRLELEGVLL